MLKELTLKPGREENRGCPGGSVVKRPPATAGDVGSAAGLRRFPRGGNGNPLQYPCLENSMDGGAWWAAAHGVTKSQTQLNDGAQMTIHSDIS